MWVGRTAIFKGGLDSGKACLTEWVTFQQRGERRGESKMYRNLKTHLSVSSIGSSGGGRGWGEAGDSEGGGWGWVVWTG